MGSLSWITPLEEALPPSRILFLFFSAEKTPRIAELVGEIIAQHPASSRRYLTETAVLWARHADRDGLEPKLVACAKKPILNGPLIRHIYSKRIRASFPRKEILGCPENHCLQFIAISQYIAKRTTFNKTGDLMV